MTGLPIMIEGSDLISSAAMSSSKPSFGTTCRPRLQWHLRGAWSVPARILHDPRRRRHLGTSGGSSEAALYLAGGFEPDAVAAGTRGGRAWSSCRRRWRRQTRLRTRGEPRGRGSSARWGPPSHWVRSRSCIGSSPCKPGSARSRRPRTSRSGSGRWGMAATATAESGLRSAFRHLNFSAPRLAPESGFGHRVVGDLEPRPRRHHRVEAVGDVREHPPWMIPGLFSRIWTRLGMSASLEEHRHDPVRIQLARRPDLDVDEHLSGGRCHGQTRSTRDSLM